MKKLLLALLVIGGIAAIVMVLRKRSEGSFEDTWDTFAELPNEARDVGSSAA
jgi:hypothetical protein